MAMYNNYKETRHIRVFISSTFADMQDERDALMKKSFPLLRERAMQRNVSLTELDLRWGITLEESENGKVVEICLREIENSVPFFIGIIGNRYGWIPSEKDLGPSVRERFPQVEMYVQKKLSVTEMEMQFGVLERKEDMNAYFFINEKEQIADADEPEKLANLKKAVRGNGRYPVSSYSSPEDLSLQVEEAFTKLLDSLFPEEGSSDFQRERVSQEAYLNSLCQNYIRRQEYFDELGGWNSENGENGKNIRMAISGPIGSGKSALLANWIKEISGPGHPGSIVVYHFIGRGGCSGTVEHVLYSICCQIRRALGYESDEQEYKTGSSSRELSALLDRIAAEDGKTVIIVLDAVERLVDVDYPERMDWLQLPPANVKVVFSIHDEEGYYHHESKLLERLKKLGMRTLPMKELSRDERISMVNNYLALYSKRLQERQIEKIVSDDLFEKPLILRTLLDELINYGHFEKLDKKIETYLGKHDSEFFQVVVEGIRQDFEDASFVLSLIAASRWGLYEDEILSITGIRRIEWSRLFCALRPHLRVDGGLISFSNGFMSRAVEDCEERYCKETANPDFPEYYYPSTEEICRQKIVDCLKKEKTERAIAEVAYQLPWNEKHDYLMDIEVFMSLYNSSWSMLRSYWLGLQDRKAGQLIDYLPLIEALPEDGKGPVLYALADFATNGKMEPDAALKFSEMALPYAKDELEKARYLRAAASACMIAEGKEPEAVDYLEHALGIIEDDMLLSFYYMDLTRAYRAIGEKEKAVKMAEKAVRIREAAYGEFRPETAVSYLCLASAYKDVQRYDRALDYARNAEFIFSLYYPEDSIPIADALETKGNIYAAMTVYSLSLDSFQKSFSIRNMLFSSGDPSMAELQRRIGLVHVLLASQELEEAADLLESTLGEGHPDTVGALRTLDNLNRLISEDDAFKNIS